MMHRVDEKRPGAFSPPPEVFVEMGKLIEEMTKAGVFLAGEGVLPSAAGARVRYEGDKRTVTDGPFTEAKEVIGGYAVMEFKSRDEAIEATKRFLNLAGGGECELHELVGPDE
jgi:hypothetical protein